MKCEYCGENISTFGKWGWVGKDKAVHSKCYEKYIKGQQQKKEINITQEVINKPQTIVKPMGEKIKHQTTGLGFLLRIVGVISFILCFFAGILMFFIRSRGESTIMLAFYNYFGLFTIGFSFFILAILCGLAELIEKK
jgi:hypothetical protein